jgi:ABC-2 type transport system permease protein
MRCLQKECGMSRSTVANYLRLTWDIKKLVIASAMSYRVSFLVQVLGMFFNDGAWMVLWSIFFKSFPTINGWGFHEMIILFAFGTLIYAFCEFPCDGVSELAKYVVTGQLDVYLTGPKNVLWSLAICKSDISALGDGLFGLVLLVYAYGFAPLKIVWFLFITLLASVVFFDFMLIVQSLAFWFGDIEDAARRVTHMLVSFMMYPQSIFKGFLKFIMMTVLPAFFMITVPVQLIMEFSWTYFAILIVSVIVATVSALWIFNKGLARYESGNLMTTRQ